MAFSLNTNLFKKQWRRFILSFSNMSRSLFVSLFGLIMNYVLLRMKAPVILHSYVYCITLVNIFLVFSNWGGKEYAVRSLSANASELVDTISRLFNSKLILFVVLCTIICLLPIPLTFKLFIAAYLLLKTIYSLFESVITLQKKFHKVLGLDLFLSAALIGMVCFDNNLNDPKVFFVEIIIIEIIRLVACLAIFPKSILLKINIRDGISVLYQSRFFAFTALAGFICSRADQYVVALFLNKQELSTYFILMNLVILCQTAFTTFINTFSANIFRSDERSFNKFINYTSWLGIMLSLASCAVIYFFCELYYGIHLDAFFLTMIFANILSFSFVFVQVFRYTRMNEQKNIFKVITLAGVINVSVSLMLVPVMGLKGAIISNTLCAASTFILFKLYSLYHKRFRRPF